MAGSLVGAHHGNLTAQFRKIAARISRVKSVTTTLPFLKRSPPMAGNKARASGTECQCDGSWLVTQSGLLALGSNRSSVEDFKDCLVLSIESDKLELRRSLRECETSANTEGRPKCLWRGGDRLCLPVLFPAGIAAPMPGGLRWRSGVVMVYGEGLQSMR